MGTGGCMGQVDGRPSWAARIGPSTDTVEFLISTGWSAPSSLMSACSQVEFLVKP